MAKELNINHLRQKAIESSETGFMVAASLINDCYHCSDQEVRAVDTFFQATHENTMASIYQSYIERMNRERKNSSKSKFCIITPVYASKNDNVNIRNYLSYLYLQKFVALSMEEIGFCCLELAKLWFSSIPDDIIFEKVEHDFYNNDCYALKSYFDLEHKQANKQKIKIR